MRPPPWLVLSTPKRLTSREARGIAERFRRGMTGGTPVVVHDPLVVTFTIDLRPIREAFRTLADAMGRFAEQVVRGRMRTLGIDPDAPLAIEALKAHDTLASAVAATRGTMRSAVDDGRFAAQFEFDYALHDLRHRWGLDEELPF